MREISIRWTTSILTLALGMFFVGTQALAQDSHEGHDNHVSAKLVQDVRDITRPFLDVNNAGPAGYGPAFGCVAGPDHGAMGIHYVNGGFVGDGEIYKDKPEALIYEPIGNKRRLVGVEYIVDAATYLKNHNNTPPQLDGQAFNLVGAPNRFNLDPFFELHVWAWRDNPQGAFVDWNNDVTCEKQ
jgi:hypothetical protein